MLFESNTKSQLFLGIKQNYNISLKSQQFWFECLEEFFNSAEFFFYLREKEVWQQVLYENNLNGPNSAAKEKARKQRGYSPKFLSWPFT